MIKDFFTSAVLLIANTLLIWLTVKYCLESDVEKAILSSALIATVNLCRYHELKCESMALLAAFNAKAAIALEQLASYEDNE